MCVVFFVLCYSKEQNHLITDECKLDEQWLGLGLGLGLGLFFILYFSVLYFSCCNFHFVFFRTIFIALTVRWQKQWKILMSHIKPQQNWVLTKKNSRIITAKNWRKKTWFWPRMYFFCGDFLHYNTGRGATPLNLRPKCPPYVVWVLCCMCVVLMCCMHVVFFVLYFPCLCCVF